MQSSDTLLPGDGGQGGVNPDHKNPWGFDILNPFANSNSAYNLNNVNDLWTKQSQQNSTAHVSTNYLPQHLQQADENKHGDNNNNPNEIDLNELKDFLDEGYKKESSSRNKQGHAGSNNLNNSRCQFNENKNFGMLNAKRDFDEETLDEFEGL